MAGPVERGDFGARWSSTAFRELQGQLITKWRQVGEALEPFRFMQLLLIPKLRSAILGADVRGTQAQLARETG